METHDSQSIKPSFLRHFSTVFAIFLLAFLPMQAQQGIGEAQSRDDGGQRSAKQSLRPLFSQMMVPSTFYTVLPTASLKIEGPKGTQVWVPAKCFLMPDGTPCTEEVTVEFKEVFDRSGFICGNAPTQSNGQLLESGGTVYIAAFAGNTPLTVAPGKSIEIRFPAGQPTADMQEFKGELDEEGEINWVISEKSEITPVTVAKNRVNPHTLEFADGMHDLKTWIYSNLKTQTKCYGEDDLFVTVYVDDLGRTTRARCSGMDACYYKSVVDMMSVIEWEVEEIRNKEKTVSFNLSPFRFKNSEEEEVLSGEYAEVKPKLDFSNYDRAFEKIELMKAGQEMASAEASNIIKTAQLGWINCDRFYNIKKPVNLMVKVEGGWEKEVAKVFVVFKEMRSVIACQQISRQSYAVANLPEGYEAYAVAVSYMDDKPYFGLAPIIIGEDVPAIPLEQISVEEMQSRMAVLDAG